MLVMLRSLHTRRLLCAAVAGFAFSACAAETTSEEQLLNKTTPANSCESAVSPTKLAKGWSFPSFQKRWFSVTKVCDGTDAVLMTAAIVGSGPFAAGTEHLIATLPAALNLQSEPTATAAYATYRPCRDLRCNIFGSSPASSGRGRVRLSTANQIFILFSEAVPAGFTVQVAMNSTKLEVAPSE